MRSTQSLWTTLVTLALALCLAVSLNAEAAIFTWDAGGGNTNWSTGLNWTGTPDNTVPGVGDDVSLASAGSVAVLDQNATVGTLTMNRGGFSLNAGGGTLTLNTGLTISNGYAASCTVATPVLVSGPNTWNKSGDYGAGTVSGTITGAALVTVRLSSCASQLTLSGNNVGFSGGFTFNNTYGGGGSGSYETPNARADAVNSLGTGQSTVNAGLPLRYSAGALAAGAPALIVNGELHFNDTPSNANDKFDVRSMGIVSGSAAQLGALTRGTNITLAANSMVAHGTLNQTSINNLGTGADLIFGMNAGFNNAAATLAAGTGTPWKGIGIDLWGDWRLTSGTVNINTTGLSEFAFVGGQNKGVPHGRMLIGSGANSPVFALSAGSPVPARVVAEQVVLDTTSPSFAAFSKFIVGGAGYNTATLTVNQANGTGTLPIDVETGSKLYAGNDGAFGGAVTVKSGGTLMVNRVLNGSGSLTVQSGGMLYLSNAGGLGGTQNGASVASAVPAGGIVQMAVSNPASLGATQPGAILESQVYEYGGYTLAPAGNFAATGQILTKNPELYYAGRAPMGDGPGGISGTLTVTAPSTGNGTEGGVNSQATPFDFRENFLAGSVVNIGPTTAGFTVRGYQQNAPVYLNNSSNAMSAIHLGGPGVNGNPILRASGPGSINGASAVSPATIDFLFADGGDFEVAGGADTYYNPISVASGKRGGISGYSYQAPGTIAWNGTVTLANSSTFATWDNTGRFTGDGNEFRSIIYSNIVVDSAATATVAQNMAGFDNGSTFRNITYVNNLTVPASSTLRKTGVGRFYINTTPTAFQGTLDITAGVFKFVTGATFTDGTLMWSGGTLTLNTDSVTGTAKFGYNNGDQNALTTTQNYTGGTIFKSGIVTFTNDNQLGGVTAPLIFDGGTLKVSTGGAYAPPSRGVILNSAGGTVDTNNNATTFSNPVSGPGGLTKAGLGNLTLGVANTFSGDTKISGGTLILGNSLALQNSTLDYNNYGGAVSFGSLSSATLGGLKGAQSLPTLPTNFALTVGGNNQSTLYSGQISGTGASLTKAGTGTLTLSATHSYSGATTVSGGKLVVNGALSNTTGVAIATGATLGGSGQINAPLSGDGLISPGNSAGILTATQVQTALNPDFAFEFGPKNGRPNYGNAPASVNDVLRLTSATAPFDVPLGNLSTVAVYFSDRFFLKNDYYLGGFYTDLGDDFLASISQATYQYYSLDPAGGILFNGQLYSPLTPNFSVLLSTVAETANFGVGDISGRVAQFTIVPEPATAILLVAGLAALVRRRRRV